MKDQEIKLFSLNASRQLAQKVSQKLGIALSTHEEREFEDGEHKTRPLVNVRECDVFLLHSLYGEPHASVNDKLCRLLFFIGALKDAAAKQVNVIVPYLCYSRKDRKTQPRDPVTTRYLASLFEAVGCTRLVTLDVHNLAAFQNAFRCATEHLEAKNLFVDYFAPLVADEDVVVVSPDLGGIKRAEQFRQVLSQRLSTEIYQAFVEKYRSAGVVSGERLVGDVSERVVIIIDDLISSGKTLARAARICVQQGASKVYAATTHGVFAEASNQILATPDLEQIVITNTIEPFRLRAEAVQKKLMIIDTSSLLAEAISRIHQGGSLIEL